ncbi:hypothetical protein IP90_03231 [Luteimonas cucumeris]|uniref:Uncharacterized protein n=1 Tax=Luteimonas cucumeris TaxID=985012 RepID=A0A562KUJ5_9GAMM|nr:hypothetical protein [Luteimonas cucumeris]TWH99052.1 hypothetical protein IP90_03231 [Luteimonas cucumeris]
MKRRLCPPLTAAALLAGLIATALLALGACARSQPPFAQLAGLLLDSQLDEISGLAASHRHDEVLWLLDDGGNPARLFAISPRGRKLATLKVEGVLKTDWEDLAAFDLDGRHYLLIADTGDNGGLRKTLQLHVVEEPDRIKDGALQPAWSIAFRWPDGPRDVEAVAVDPVRGEILLVSKKRQPPELFMLPLRPGNDKLQTARRIGQLAGVPQPSAADKRENAALARRRSQVTSAALSPDRRTLAVMTYRDLLLYPRRGDEDWGQAVARKPQRHELPWLPQPEALDWARHGRGLYATGEFAPAPLLYLQP